MKQYLPYIIGVILIVGGVVARGIVKWNYKQSQHEQYRVQQESDMSALKESLKDLSEGESVVVAE